MDYETFEGTEDEVKAKIEALNESSDDVKIKTKKIIKEIEKEVGN